MLVPGNRNQQYAAAAIFLELKWSKGLVPSLTHLEKKHRISRRILQRARARLARLGVIEHISYLSNRYGGQHGWRLSSRFATALRQLATKSMLLRDKATSTQDKDGILLQLIDARRKNVGTVTSE